MKKNLIWLSFDLSVQGDYEGMYAWLDAHHAKECGDSVAALEYEYEKDLIEELKQDLEESVKTDKRTRVYVIYHVSKRLKGRFIFGRRKNSPWYGYAPTEGEEAEDVAL